MTLTALAPYVTILITVVIWALTQRANRQHEIFKERLRKRVDMFDGLLPEISRFIDALNMEDNCERTAQLSLSINKFGRYRVKMFCYATHDERQAYEDFVAAINAKNMSLLSEKNRQLVDLAQTNLRAELGLK